MTVSLTAIVLTYNEERHIARCLESLSGVAARVVVVDSLSTDRTTTIAASQGATVLQNPFANYATQFNWALRAAQPQTEWCLRIDADEYLTEELRVAVRVALAEGGVPLDVTGLYVNRVIHFGGSPIRWGGCYPVRMLRLFRGGVGKCEDRWMDEHIVLKRGKAGHLSGDLVDDNLNNIGWWTMKHNNYATREAIDLLLASMQSPSRLSRAPRLLSAEGRKRFLKTRVYARLPVGVRAVLYFVYRYFLKLGILDGSAGFMFHFLQGCWYRVLVDAKVSEIQRIAKATGSSWQSVVFKEYGQRIPAAERPSAPTREIA